MEKNNRLKIGYKEWKRIHSNGIYGLDDGTYVLSIEDF